MIWGAFGAPHKGSKKILKKKTKVKSREIILTAIHIHGALQAGQQPRTKRSKIASNRHIAFPNRNVRKMKFGLAIRKSIAQAQAQKHASRQGKNHAENSKPSSR